MASTLRVHSLAKELGVPSKAIIEKCRAEGVELKNHMAAISIGLAESIREWFSVGVDVTTVEVAQPVDVEEARRARRRRQREEEAAGIEPEVAAGDEDSDTAAISSAESELDEAAAIEAEVAIPEAAAVEPEVEPETDQTLVVAAEVPSVSPTEVSDPEFVVEHVADQAVTLEISVDETGPDEVDDSTPPTEQRPAAAVPARPTEPIRPAGPQVVPLPAELRGPKVVRIEAPEPVRAPRPRPVPRGPGGPAAPGVAATTTTATPPRRRGKGRKAEEEEAARARARSPRRHGGATDVDQRLREWRDQDLLERKERLASVTGQGLAQRRAAERRRQTGSTTGPQTRKDPVVITAPLSLKEFCSTAGVPFAALSQRLMEHTGQLWTINQQIDAETAEMLVLDLGLGVSIARAKTAYEQLRDEFDSRERKHLKPRPPVVAMLGHVDHGKTSLLDAIRRTRVAAGEAGGITQHIGAYRVTRDGWDVTFVDTPGHQAFTEMRARGANLTDVVVLVVAADDGVMPQTAEAINHAKAAGVAIVVALNKIDLPGVDLNRIYAQLSEHELTPAEWGGSTDVLKTSATSGQGVDELVGHLSTLSELLELTADATVPARATVIEAQMREGRGVVAQVLVREGTLKVGDIVVCGPGSGRVRSLRDDRGRTVKAAMPGSPVEVSGLDELPIAGDDLFQVDQLARAKSIAEEVREQRRTAGLAQTLKPKTLEDLMRGDTDTEVPALNVILKADVQGSVQVLRQTLADFPADKARLTILHAAVGAITEADVQLARASGAIVIGFHVVAEDRAASLADQLGVEIRNYRVIYELRDDLHKALAGLLAPIEKEETRGTIEVRQVFNVSRIGTIAGCLVTDGVVHRNHRVRIVRDGRVISEGRGIASLKRFKDDAREVRAGFECGVKIEGFDDVKPGDILQAYEITQIAQEL